MDPYACHGEAKFGRPEPTSYFALDGGEVRVLYYSKLDLV
jgi:hypothetical protein